MKEGYLENFAMKLALSEYHKTLAPNKRQAITWISNDQDSWPHMASWAHNELSPNIGLNIAIASPSWHSLMAIFSFFFSKVMSMA